MENEKAKILVLFYSMHGHTFKMIQAVRDGIKEAGGDPILKQVPELIPEEKWDENIKKAKETMSGVPTANPKEDLNNIDGIVVATPTRFGNMAAQMRNFWDQTSSVWMNGDLIGKPAAFVTGSSTQHGGQETTIISSMLTLLHHGAIIVGLPYSFKEQMQLDEISGGSPYGASTITGPMGERDPSEIELKLAKDLGTHLSSVAEKLKN